MAQADPRQLARVAGAERALRRIARQAGATGRGVLEVLTERTRDAVFVLDPDRQVVFFSRRAEAITGFRREEVLGRHCLTGFKCTRCLAQCALFTRDAVEDVDLEIFRRDGEQVRVRKSATVLRDDDDRLLGAVEVFRELPEPTAAAGHDDLVWLTLASMLGPLGHGLVVVDAAFRIRWVSEAFTELAGRAAEAMTGAPASLVLGEELLDAGAEFRVDLVAHGRQEAERGGITRPDGTRRPVWVTGTAVPPGVPGTGGPGFLLVVRPEGADAPDAGEVTVFEGMVTRSPVMRSVFHLVDHLRASDATVLLTGESGSGKELVARAIHARSTRAAEPFVAVNCGALPEQLLETELFGHARGAFTGAVQARAGRFEVAGGGTLFLDEIGDLPLALQVKLLRVLQEHTFERLGENLTRPFRARVVAATHQDLSRLVAEGRFRQDLYYRLNVVPLSLPALRERPEDVEPLIHHILAEQASPGQAPPRLSPGARHTLLGYDWPGNVRQLENALAFATAVGDGRLIHEGDLPPEVRGAGAAAPPPPRAPPAAPLPAATAGELTYPTEAQIREALAATRYRRREAAERLGISRTTLWRRMKALGLG